MFAECTLNALKQAKRFHATVAFDTDTIGLKKAMEKGMLFYPPSQHCFCVCRAVSCVIYSPRPLLLRAVQNYKPLIKDFPISELLTASDIPKLADAIVKLFQHLKKAKNAHYPIPRYLRLVEVSQPTMQLVRK